MFPKSFFHIGVRTLLFGMVLYVLPPHQIAQAAFYDPSQAGFYLGLGGGTAQLEGRCNAVLRVLKEVECQHNEAEGAWRGYMGYQFNRYFGLEAGYVDLGKSEMVTQGFTTVERPRIPGGTTVLVDALKRISGFTLAGIANWPMSERFTLFGKVGYFEWDATYRDDISVRGATINALKRQQGPDTTGGIGLLAKLHRNWSLRFGWDYFANDGDHEDFFYIDIVWRKQRERH